MICGLSSSLSQSPIDLSDDDATLDSTIRIKLAGYGSAYKNPLVSGTEHETNWEVQLEETSWVESAKLVITNADGEKTTFPPLQFHFHTPSEHTIDGVHTALEGLAWRPDEGTAASAARAATR